MVNVGTLNNIFIHQINCKPTQTVRPHDSRLQIGVYPEFHIIMTTLFLNRTEKTFQLPLDLNNSPIAIKYLT